MKTLKLPRSLKEQVSFVAEWAELPKPDLANVQECYDFVEENYEFALEQRNYSVQDYNNFFKEFNTLED